MTLNHNYVDELHYSKIYSICGNRIVMYQVEMTDQLLRGANHLSNLCWLDGQRIADGVACLSPRENYTRFCFFNPDGSFELVCGNALFAAAALLSNVRTNSLKICPFDIPPIELYAKKDKYTITTPVSIGYQPILLESLPPSLIHNTGSPHLIVQVDNVANVNLSKLGPIVTNKLEVNLTIFSVCNGKILARTYERGVEAETDACGTGAMAVAIEANIRSIDASSIIYPGGIYKVKIFKTFPQPTVALSVDKAYVELIENAIQLNQVGSGCGSLPTRSGSTRNLG
jgi:diaminopimelate epimerase